MRNRKVVIFTDLDGSLLNHQDYSFKEALPMLSWIKSHKIDLIFTTSKTKKECEVLQQKMGIVAPFIVENGACIYFPDGEKELLGRPHQEIVDFLALQKKYVDFWAFYEMNVEEVMQKTGFGKEQAILAKEREFSEPFVLKEQEGLEVLEDAAKKAGFKILRGGRFFHCVGSGQDKGKAVKRALAHYRGFQSIGIGDNYNDIAMLESVDVPILIPKEGGEYISLVLPSLLKAPYEGSLGWNEALKSVLVDAF